MKNIEILYIDLFCGAGGTSTGIENAMQNGKKCAKVIACVNHDKNAIASHKANHPDTLHFTEDIRTFDLTLLIIHLEHCRRIYPNAKVVLWASLECTNFSIAKGGMSRDADSRTLAEHLYRYIDAINPDYIQIENVKEFMTWGALVEKVATDKNGAQYCPLQVKSIREGKNKTQIFLPVWIPDSSRKGEYYNAWVAKIKAYGYKFKHRILDSADYGAYTSRKRYFGIFARPELPIAFPKPSHAKNPSGNLKKWNAVKDVLDFSLEGESIFMRKKPLAEATLERIYAGLIKFVAGGKDKFLVKYNSMNVNGKYIAPGVDDPCPTVCVQGRLAYCNVHFLSKHFSGHPDSKNHIARMDKMPPYIITTETGGFAIKICESDSEIMRKIKRFMALYGIVDIKMRMLVIEELLRIMGFGADYTLIGTKAERKKYIGNAVEVTLSCKLCEATVGVLPKYELKLAV